MGMDNNKSGLVKQGFKLFEDVLDFAGGGEEDPSTDYSGDYEEQARMMELDAQGRANEVARTTREQARKTHAQQEQARAKAHTQWGQSGVAMSGSRELVREGREKEGREQEENELFEGELREKAILSDGQRDANLYRIRKGVSPSTLSLGSTIYKYRR